MPTPVSIIGKYFHGRAGREYLEVWYPYFPSERVRIECHGKSRIEAVENLKAEIKKWGEANEPENRKKNTEA